MNARIASTIRRHSLGWLVAANVIGVLLAVLDGRSGWSDYDVLAKSSAAGMRWNRQFADLARAVLLGRDGRCAEAAEAFESAQEAAALYPMARHLGLRLVAPEAAAWGDPVTWLRTAEEYFHETGIPAVASACRGLLRQAGAPVQQRRSGTDQVPKQLRGHGVTVRECDVASGELPEGAFDLVHARLVLQHVTDRPAAVGRLARALRPGGFLVLEDTDTAPLFSHPTRPDFLGDVRRAAYEVMCASGYHPRCGLLDEELARAVGLAGVRSEGRCVVVRGGSGAARWYALWISHLRPGILARTDLTARHIDAALAELADPGNVWLSQVMVTVTGRRPLPGERAAQGGDR